MSSVDIIICTVYKKAKTNKMNLCRFFIVCLYSYCRLGDIMVVIKIQQSVLV